MNKRLNLLIFLSFIYLSTSAQITLASPKYKPDTYFNVKQFAEFINRFNYEKDPWGNGTDSLKKYISRPGYMHYLFYDSIYQKDKQQRQLKEEFIDFIVDNKIYLSHEKQKITAIAKAKVLFSEKSYSIKLYLHKKTDKTGASQWFIYNAELSELADLLADKQTAFIPPNDNELEFIQMSKNLQSPANNFDMVSPEAQISDLALFIIFTNQGELQFEYVESLRYEINFGNKWMAIIENQTKLSSNSGWLIHRLQKF